ncbi:MAG: LPS export ABC transporter periplasmic protein LptC [Gemmatimonadota bacterium]
MRDRITMIIAILLLAVVTATSYWYSRVMRQPEAAQPPRPGTPDVVVDRLVLTQFDEQGRARNKLFGQQLRHFPDNDDIEVTAPRLVSLRPDQPRVAASARTARVVDAGERVQLNGDVVITRSAFDGEPEMRLTTDYLLALPDEDRYRTDRPVKVTRGASMITANSMDFDNIARTVVMVGAVHTLIEPRPSGRH